MVHTLKDQLSIAQVVNEGKGRLQRRDALVIVIERESAEDRLRGRGRERGRLPGPWAKCAIEGRGERASREGAAYGFQIDTGLVILRAESTLSRHEPRGACL